LNIIVFDSLNLRAQEKHQQQISNKAPRRKQRGINCALQSAGFQPAFAPRGRGIKPAEIKTSLLQQYWNFIDPINLLMTLNKERIYTLCLSHQPNVSKS